jgi:hypothetical protein
LQKCKQRVKYLQKSLGRNYIKNLKQYYLPFLSTLWFILEGQEKESLSPFLSSISVISLCSFSNENKKVKHHDHITGDFIDTLCNDCNLKYQYKRFLPVYIHNLKGYDSHLFVKSLYQYGYKPDEKGNNISCGAIDTAMVIIPYKLFKNEKWILDKYEADGYYIVECYNKHRNIHIFVDNNLCYYNKIGR